MREKLAVEQKLQSETKLINLIQDVIATSPDSQSARDKLDDLKENSQKETLKDVETELARLSREELEMERRLVRAEYEKLTNSNSARKQQLVWREQQLVLELKENPESDQSELQNVRMELQEIHEMYNSVQDAYGNLLLRGAAKLREDLEALADVRRSLLSDIEQKYGWLAIDDTAVLESQLAQIDGELVQVREELEQAMGERMLEVEQPLAQTPMTKDKLSQAT